MGLPLAISSPPKSMWDKIVDKFQKFLARWKCRYLSLRGRLTLIKAALSNLRHDFLWSGKNNQKKLHLLDWQEVCKHFQEGGASIKNLKIMNQALLGKWIWRLGTEGGTLWNSIIKGKYRSSPSGWWTRESSWMGEVPLKFRFPNIYRVAPDKNATVASRFSISAANTVWDVKCSRNLHDWEISEFVDLLDHISKSLPDPTSSDKLIWF
ncbi:uncharacterized protein LOC131253828 [Magnolia sinica]|uniref:uncharacterized protein LOC131253828 n=1 Tax=Magnolia sinica TaxID=86752 RepID=UPI0026594B88|nr:uncharacterized protein LOC131253828 [Magnolia sinica]